MGHNSFWPVLMFMNEAKTQYYQKNNEALHDASKVLGQEMIKENYVHAHLITRLQDKIKVKSS
jgi:hypothetical protein